MSWSLYLCRLFEPLVRDTVQFRAVCKLVSFCCCLSSPDSAQFLPELVSMKSELWALSHVRDPLHPRPCKTRTLRQCCCPALRAETRCNECAERRWTNVYKPNTAFPQHSRGSCWSSCWSQEGVGLMKHFLLPGLYHFLFTDWVHKVLSLQLRYTISVHFLIICLSLTCFCLFPGAGVVKVCVKMYECLTNVKFYKMYKCKGFVM